MYSYYKTVNDLVGEIPAIGDILINADSYLAHLPGEGSRRTPETLEAHINLVNNYLVRLVEAHRLDPVINNIINGISSDRSAEIGNYIKKLFVNAVVFHDFGKVNERFQVDKMHNPVFADLDKDSPIGSTHSSLGAFIYLSVHLNEIINAKKSDLVLLKCCIHLSYSIFRHHSKTLDDNWMQTVVFAASDAGGELEMLRDFLSRYINCFRYKVPPAIVNLIGNIAAMKRILEGEDDNPFHLYALCKLNFSLLTASDYLATHEYMSGEVVSDFGTLGGKRIESLFQHVTDAEWLDKDTSKKNYNKLVYNDLEGYIEQSPTEKSAANLNILRKEMAISVIAGIRKHASSNLFYIEAPTGGGKTNLSQLATMELLKLHGGTYNKVFYVFPFTTLITQTFTSAKETLGLNGDEMIAMHSRASFRDNGAVIDGAYGSQQLNYVNHLFANFPFCFLSHIKFFDILKTNEKEANYLFHRLANSIVVIDELQSYNPSQWDKMIYFIRQHAALFNVKFILMSATLPKLDKLEVIKDSVGDIIHLLPDAKKDYFRNPNFSKRVSFNYDLFDRVDLTLEELASKVIAVSGDYMQYDFGILKPRGSVYTIVEFIYKRSATDFYDVIDQYDFFDAIYVLSGTILEFRRKEIIQQLKHTDNRKLKILLITTQVVEAGVDIDMDVAFKDRSIIDSDEQLAGRVNRNVSKENCLLFLFNLDRESVIYGKDSRFEITRKCISKSEYKRILEEKDFDALYDQIFAFRNSWNRKEMAENLSDYVQMIRKLRFHSVNTGFQLISQKNISCFIPINMPLTINIGSGKASDSVFTENELVFLEQYGILPGLGFISGEAVFDLYIHSIHNKVSFIRQKIKMKLLQSILSKYVFSIFSTDKMSQLLVHFSDVEKSGYGYAYIERWSEIYSIEKGLDAKKLGGVEETQFL